MIVVELSVKYLGNDGLKIAIKQEQTIARYQYAEHERFI